MRKEIYFIDLFEEPSDWPLGMTWHVNLDFNARVWEVFPIIGSIFLPTIHNHGWYGLQLTITKSFSSSRVT